RGVGAVLMTPAHQFPTGVTIPSAEHWHHPPEDRDPAVLARFVRLRVIDPEGAYWRHGIEAAGRWLRETGSTVLRVPYTVVTEGGGA
ncbi:hypothetical protein, partial [Streptomyces sp. NPDC001948]